MSSLTGQLEKYSWLDEFLDAAEMAVGFMDMSTMQPTSWRHFQPLIAREWLDWFYEIIEERKRQGVSYERIAEALKPELCRDHSIFTFEDLKSARWPLEKRLKVADFFYQTLKAHMPQGDVFGLHGTTRRHAPQEVEELMERDFEKGTPEIARELGKLYNAAYNLGAALYLDFYMGKAVGNYGPYPLPSGRILVIKRMHCLRPTEVWPDIGTTLDTINLFAVYEGVQFSTDLVTCHTQYTGDVLNGLKQWRMERNGKPVVDIAEIKEIAANLAHIGAHQWGRVVGLPEAELLEKSVWIRCYCFKKARELLGLDWRPTPELLGAVKGKTLAEGWKTWNAPEDGPALKEYWRNIWDPRKDFYPGH